MRYINLLINTELNNNKATFLYYNEEKHVDRKQISFYMNFSII